jgi:hypothetical protein
MTLPPEVAASALRSTAGLEGASALEFLRAGEILDVRDLNGATFIDGEPITEALSRGEETMIAYGRNGERASVGEPVLAEPFGRRARVSIIVTYEVPVIAIPFIGGFGSLEPVESTHSEIVDPFRDGLEGVASC